MSNNKNDSSSVYSWPIIILVLCVFWPAGLYLLIKRCSSDKNNKTKTSPGTGLKITGIVLIVLGCCGIIGCFQQFDLAALISLLLFIVIGIVLLNEAKKVKAKDEITKKYISIIVNGGERQIDSIASTMGKQYEVAKKDIQNIIDKGLLKDAYIKENTREVVLPGDNLHKSYESSQPKVVTCPCCGANNTVSGGLNECEYCGAPLK